MTMCGYEDVLLLLSIAMWTLSGATIYLETEKQSGNNLYIDMESFDFLRNSTTSFTFNVMAASNAHVALLDRNKAVIYEIYIGGYSNTKSQIRYYQDNSNQFDTNNDYNLLSASEYRQFRLNWTNRIVTVEKNPSTWSTFLRYYVPASKIFEVFDVGVSTSMHDTGNWKIQTNDDQTYFKTPESASPSNINYMPLSDFGIGAISKSLLFAVKTCSGAYIRLENPTTNLLIKLGDNNNAATSIHSQTDSRIYSVQNTVDSQHLHCHKSILFKIKFDEKNVSVQYHDGCRMQTFLTMENALMSVDAVNVGVGSELETLWKIHDNDDVPVCDDEESSTAAMTTIVTSSDTATVDCAPCYMVCVRNGTIENSTMLEALVEQLKQELTVPLTETSNFIRSKTSAPDERQSAATIGYIGGLFLGAVFLSVIILDINTFVSHFRMLRRNILN